MKLPDQDSTGPIRIKIANPETAYTFIANLQLIFITLKLLNEISWPWWQVTIMLWLPLAIVLSVFCIMFLGNLLRGKE